MLYGLFRLKVYLMRRVGPDGCIKQYRAAAADLIDLNSVEKNARSRSNIEFVKNRALR